MKYILNLFFLLFVQFCFGQNTVGTIVYDADLALESYNLFFPNLQSDVFLVDNCGQLVNHWVGDENTRPGFVAKLDMEGNLIKAMSSSNLQNFFGAGGSGGLLESRDWNNEILWQHLATDSIIRQHHDFEIMPNGNILYIVWERKFKDEIIDLGFDTITNPMQELWFDCIKEYNPTLDSIVWEWCSYNHLVQEIHSNLPNYDIVKERPDLIDINYQEYSFNRADWMHSNSVAYNETLDQVALCVRNFNEIWLIDHSTTIQEAASQQGGNSNKGGRLLHRWGNPAAYNMGDTLSRRLFYPHNVKWIQNTSSVYNGEILVYNNVIEPSFSMGAMYETPLDENGDYKIENGIYLPTELTRTISHPDTTKNTSGQGSNIVLLENGNFFMQAASQGTAFELTDNETVVWEYVIPIAFGDAVPQGSILTPGLNFNFSMTKYPVAYSAFEGKDLSPDGYIELDPDTKACTISSINESNFSNSFEIIANPVYSTLEIQSEGLFELALSNGQGIFLSKHTIRKGLNQINVSDLKSGLYVLFSHDQKIGKRFLKL